MRRLLALVYQAMPTAGLLLSVGMLTVMAWQVTGALAESHRVHVIRESVVAGILAEDAAYDAVSRMVDGPLKPFTVPTPTGLVARVEASVDRGGEILRIEVEGRKERSYRYVCELLPGAAPEILGNPLTVRHSMIAARPAMQRWLRRNLDVRLDPVEDDAMAGLLDPVATAPVRGAIVDDLVEDDSIGLLRLRDGTDRPDFRVVEDDTATWRPAIPASGIRVLEGNLWLDHGSGPLRIELERALTLVVVGNIYLGRSVVVRGAGRLILVARTGGAATYVDADGSGGWSEGDLLPGAPDSSYRGPIEGSGAVYLGLPGSAPAGGPPIDLDGSVVAEGEVYLGNRNVTVHGALVVGQALTWAGAGQLRLPGDGLPNVERELVPGFRRRGGRRPGLLVPVR